MTRSTPPKHRTPNWRLVRRIYTGPSAIGGIRRYSISTWQPLPLRQDRKDLKQTDAATRST